MRTVQLGVDGNCGFALCGLNLHEGKAEFVEIDLPVERSRRPNRYDDPEWCDAATRAANIALQKLRARLHEGDGIAYRLGPSHPMYTSKEHDDV